jgi:hypothetical protein
VIPPGRARDALYLVAESSEPLDVAAHRAGVHLQAFSQVGSAPGGAPLEQPEEAEKACGGIAHPLILAYCGPDLSA